MARIRTIKPEFWRSPSTASAGPWARLLYIAMWNWADDYGVAEWTPRELLGFAFPNDEQLSAADFPQLLAEVRGSFGVVFFMVGGRRYYSIPAWDQHQKSERKAQSKYPAPDGPESVPDPEFVDFVGSSAPFLGSSVAGTGEQGNRGTGEQGGAALENPASPPSPFCPRHQASGGTEQPCRGCKYAAADREKWERAQLTPEVEYFHEHRWLDDDTCMTCTERRF